MKSINGQRRVRVLAALKLALSDSAVRKNLSDEGAEPVGSTPEEYAAFTRSEIDKWIKVARAAGIQFAAGSGHR